MPGMGRTTGRYLLPRGLAATLVVTISLAGCDRVPREPPCGRGWVIAVENQSHGSVALSVAENGPMGMGAIIGTADPSTVPANSSQDVTFCLSSGDGWAIFVDPGPDTAPLMTVPSNQVPNVNAIVIDPYGTPSWRSSP
jgi:hypothetical protein